MTVSPETIDLIYAIDEKFGEGLGEHYYCDLTASQLHAGVRNALAFGPQQRIHHEELHKRVRAFIEDDQRKVPERVRVLRSELERAKPEFHAALLRAHFDRGIRRALGISETDLFDVKDVVDSLVTYLSGAKPSPTYPEHAKFRAVEAQWNACRDFALWLEQEFANIEFPSPVDEYLSEYFDIDLKKLSAEKDAMAEALAQNAARTPRR